MFVLSWTGFPSNTGFGLAVISMSKKISLLIKEPLFGKPGVVFVLGWSTKQYWSTEVLISYWVLELEEQRINIALPNNNNHLENIYFKDEKMLTRSTFS